MKLEFTTQLPIWFTLFCLILALGLSFLLYFRDKKFRDLAKWKLRLMAVLRFLFIFILSFLLLSPLLKSAVRHIEKPILLLAHDNSSSLLYTSDSLFYSTKYQEDLNEFTRKLSEKYKVREFTMGEELRTGLELNFNDKISSFDKSFEEIHNLFYNRNVGALIFASDGIYNKGGNPVRNAEQFAYPVLSLALGDTSIRRDASIAEINHNKIAFLGNDFPVQVFVNSTQLSGETVSVKILNKGNVLYEDKVDVSSADFSHVFNAELEAASTGLQRYSVVIQSMKEESNLLNNKTDFLIDVIDSKQKILILGNSPHPDMGAIQKALSTNENFEVESIVVSDFDGNVSDYNLLILHQLPAINNAATDLLDDIFENKISALFIVGGQSDIKNLNNLGIGVRIGQTKNSLEESQAIINEQFNLFELDKEESQLVFKYPPLITPFGNYSLGSSATVLMYQRIKNVETTNPLISFSRLDEHKVGMICGEGIWRWRLNNYLQQNDHKFFNELMNKTVQYLSLRVKKERFTVNAAKLYGENEPVKFAAELYNESYEPISGPDIKLIVTDGSGINYSYNFNYSNGNYELDAGRFDVGDYSFLASVELNRERFEQTGNFSIYPINIETVNTIANHKLLYQLAGLNNGEVYYPDQFEILLEDIDKRSDIVSVSSLEERIMEMINLKWIFFLLLLFISLEWFLRKFFGGY